MTRPTPYLDDGDIQLHQGDAIAVLKSLPAGIAQTCITSPPYWGLRDYGTGTWTGGDEACDHMIPGGGPKRGLNSDGHNIKYEVSTKPAGATCPRCGAQRTDSQLGLEATPTQYVERMVAVFREVWRVLRDDATCWINLGDSFLPGKQLAGIPWRVAFALQADGWYLRSDIIWSKPNPMPESVTDRPTKSHEYLFLFSKQPRYFYDADAIREPHEDPTRHAGHWTKRPNNGDGSGGLHVTGDYGRMGNNDAGRNRRSVWVIPTEPFPEAHFATYPQALVTPCIQAGSSEKGQCVACGAPWRRVVERGELAGKDRGGNYKGREAEIIAAKPPGARVGMNPGTPGMAYENRTTGWAPSCTCHGRFEDYEAVPATEGVDNAIIRRRYVSGDLDQHPPRPQLVLDPFIGSGTTALVARRHGRRCIGIDLSAEYLAIAAKRTQQLSLLA